MVFERILCPRNNITQRITMTTHCVIIFLPPSALVSVIRSRGAARDFI